MQLLSLLCWQWCSVGLHCRMSWKVQMSMTRRFITRGCFVWLSQSHCLSSQVFMSRRIFDLILGTISVYCFCCDMLLLILLFCYVVIPAVFFNLLSVYAVICRILLRHSTNWCTSSWCGYWLWGRKTWVSHSPSTFLMVPAVTVHSLPTVLLSITWH